ncbi:MAG: ABC transporter permease, partial [Verrucomicrobia bacterium]|nr:ABC transporter permease [Verrucomicrobiota bacterium]
MSLIAAVSGVHDSGGYRRPPNLVAWLVLMPLLAWLFLFVIVPTVMLVVVSFAERDALGRIVYD